MKISEVNMDLINVFVNGKKIELASGTSLLVYLDSNGLMNQKAFAVALNQEIVQKEDYQIITPKDYSDPIIYAEKSKFYEKRHFSAAIARDDNLLPV